MNLTNTSQSYRSQIIAGRKALIEESQKYLCDCQAELHEARRAEKRFVRLSDWQGILCERAWISKLRHREFIALGNVKHHAKRIAELEEKGV